MPISHKLPQRIKKGYFLNLVYKPRMIFIEKRDKNITGNVTQSNCLPLLNLDSKMPY